MLISVNCNNVIIFIEERNIIHITLNTPGSRIFFIGGIFIDCSQEPGELFKEIDRQIIDWTAHQDFGVAKARGFYK